MRLSELLELVDDDHDGYLFFKVDGVKYEIDELIEDDKDEIILAGFME